MTEIITVERRRRWSDDDKRRIVAETYEPDASVSAVAKRHGLHPGQVFDWRRALRETPRATGFAPVMVRDPEPERPPRLPAPDVAKPGSHGRIEIILGRGRRVVVGADVDAEALRRVLEVLEQR